MQLEMQQCEQMRKANMKYLTAGAKLVYILTNEAVCNIARDLRNVCTVLDLFYLIFYLIFSFFDLLYLYVFMYYRFICIHLFMFLRSSETLKHNMTVLHRNFSSKTQNFNIAFFQENSTV